MEDLIEERTQPEKLDVANRPEKLEAPDRPTDPMAPFGIQAGISIASGLVGLALAGPMGGALGMAIGAGGAAGYPFIADLRKSSHKVPVGE